MPALGWGSRHTHKLPLTGTSPQCASSTGEATAKDNRAVRKLWSSPYSYPKPSSLEEFYFPHSLGEMAQEGGSEMLCNVTAEKRPLHCGGGGQAGAGGPGRTRSIPRLGRGGAGAAGEAGSGGGQCSGRAAGGRTSPRDSGG